MKNIKAKIWALLGTAVMILPFALGLGSVKVEADVTPVTGDVTVTLHKLRFTSTPTVSQNTGLKLSEDEISSTFGPNSAPLSGVEFTVYDVTKDYYSSEKPDYSSSLPTNKELVANGVQTTTGNGEATFTLPARSNVGTQETPVMKDAVYVFVETEREDVTVAPAGNLTLVLPFYPSDDPATKDIDESNSASNIIHLYPKNVVKPSAKITIAKASTHLPKKFEEYMDLPQEQIEQKLIDDSLLAGAEFQITRQKNDQVEYYKENDNETGIAIFTTEKAQAHTFKTPESAENVVKGQFDVSGLLDGVYQLVEISAPEGYQKSFSEDTTENKKLIDSQRVTEFEIKNNKLVPTSGYEGVYNALEGVSLGNPEGYYSNIFDGKKILDRQNTVTVENVQNYGSNTFIKEDLNTGKALDGAIFYVSKTKDAPAFDEKAGAVNPDYLYEKPTEDGEYSYAWGSEVADITDAVEKAKYVPVQKESENGGTFSLENLKYGTYYLYEATAPDDYTKPDSKFSFEISATSGANNSEAQDTIKNQPKGILPSTGGTGIVVFLVAGIVLIGGAVIYFKKRRQETEA